MANALRARFEVLPSLGHLSMMQAPRIIADKLSEFLHQVEAS
jgi:hypothetical protein